MNVSKPVAVVPPAVRAKYTPLQKHVAYFDGNDDGKITIGETRKGLADLGMGGVSRFFASIVIVLGLGKQTSGKFSEVDVANIHKGKHDSDTDVYDADGNFDPKEFEKMWATWDKDRSGSLSDAEFTAMRTARKESKLGAFAASQEFGLLTKLAADGKEKVGDRYEPAISRARMEQFYDGSLFGKLAAERAAKK